MFYTSFLYIGWGEPGDRGAYEGTLFSRLGTASETARAFAIDRLRESPASRSLPAAIEVQGLHRMIT